MGLDYGSTPFFVQEFDENHACEYNIDSLFWKFHVIISPYKQNSTATTSWGVQGFFCEAWFGGKRTDESKEFPEALLRGKQISILVEWMINI